uniref:Glutathione hydrolase 1 proenzyme-like isoform X1 n=2 Tax=Diabrotica virgifera virgifera TaxID=50390 RepID=A0A6P7EXX7_DIAVI
MVEIERYNQKKVQVIVTCIVMLVLLVVGAVTAVIIFLPSITRNVFGQSPNKGVVVSNVKECAAVGTSILSKGGNAVDSAIATLLCETVSKPDLSKTGGDFVMTFFNKSTGEVFVLNAREPPQNSTTESLENHMALHGIANQTAGKLIVPVEIRAYWTAYKRLGGGVSWKEIIDPTIDLCLSGIEISVHTAKLIKQYKEIIYSDLVLRETFINTETNDTYVKGQVFRRPKVAEMLKIISEKDIDVLFNSTYSNGSDVHENGFFYTDDEDNYEYIWQKHIEVELGDGKKLITAPLPSAAISVALSLKFIDSFRNLTNLNLTSSQITSILQGAYKSTVYNYMQSNNVTNVTEVLQTVLKLEPNNFIRTWIAYSRVPKISSIEASSILPDDYAIAHVNVLSVNGDAVSVTSTDNYEKLSKMSGIQDLSKTTGFRRDRFSSTDLDNNTTNDYSSFYKNDRLSEKYISVACPIIILDKDKTVLLVTGGIGDNTLLSNILQVLNNFIWRNMDIETAILVENSNNSQLVPQNDFEEDMLGDNLKNETQETNDKMFISEIGEFSAVSTIVNSKATGVKGVYDKTSGGSVSYVT